MEEWPEIDFVDDRDGCMFTATDHRKSVKRSVKKTERVGETILKESQTAVESLKTSGKTSGKILSALTQDGNLTIPELAALIGVTERSIERNIKNLQEQGLLRRIGPAKGGHWEVP